jgi:hypothetical protein
MDGLDDNCCHVGLVIVKQSSWNFFHKIH